MDNSLVQKHKQTHNQAVKPVLILVVMDNSLVQVTAESLKKQLAGLNPCCNGQ